MTYIHSRHVAAMVLLDTTLALRSCPIQLGNRQFDSLIILPSSSLKVRIENGRLMAEVLFYQKINEEYSRFTT